MRDPPAVRRGGVPAKWWPNLITFWQSSAVADRLLVRRCFSIDALRHCDPKNGASLQPGNSGVRATIAPASDRAPAAGAQAAGHAEELPARASGPVVGAGAAMWR